MAQKINSRWRKGADRFPASMSEEDKKVVAHFRRIHETRKWPPPHRWFNGAKVYPR